MALAIACILTGVGETPCMAHPTYFTSAHAVVQAGGTCRVSLQFDTLAFVLNDTSARIGNEPMEALLAAPRPELEKALEGARGRFERSFAAVTDRGPVAATTRHFATADDVARLRESGPVVLPVSIPVEMEMTLPAEATTVSFKFPEIVGDVLLTVERPDEDFFTEPVSAGKPSTVLPVRLEKPPSPG